MTLLAIGLAAVIWLACGIIAYRLDKKDFPKTVDPVGDVLLSAALLLSGPCGLLGLLFMRTSK